MKIRLRIGILIVLVYTLQAQQSHQNIVAIVEPNNFHPIQHSDAWYAYYHWECGANISTLHYALSQRMPIICSCKLLHVIGYLIDAATKPSVPYDITKHAQALARFKELFSGSWQWKASSSNSVVSLLPTASTTIPLDLDRRLNLMRAGRITAEQQEFPIEEFIELLPANPFNLYLTGHGDKEGSITSGIHAQDFQNVLSRLNDTQCQLVALSSCYVNSIPLMRLIAQAQPNYTIALQGEPDTTTHITPNLQFQDYFTLLTTPTICRTQFFAAGIQSMNEMVHIINPDGTRNLLLPTLANVIGQNHSQPGLFSSSPHVLVSNVIDRPLEQPRDLRAWEFISIFPGAGRYYIKELIGSDAPIANPTKILNGLLKSRSETPRTYFISKITAEEIQPINNFFVYIDPGQRLQLVICYYQHNGIWYCTTSKKGKKMFIIRPVEEEAEPDFRKVKARKALIKIALLLAKTKPMPEAFTGLVNTLNNGEPSDAQFMRKIKEALPTLPEFN